MKNFKKVLALVLVLATLLGLATMASATEYKDADKIAADYDEAIKVLDLIETMQGYPNGEFRPTANITREEAAKLIAIFDNKDADISTYYTSINPFADEKGRWGESYVGYGYRAGIIAGMNATTFAPTANVTGTQFLKMALVTLGYDQEAEGFVGSSWAVNVLALAKKIGLIDDLADGWKPENDLTREEAAQILLNTLKAETVEYAQEAKQVGFRPTKVTKDEDGKALATDDIYWTWQGKVYLTVAGAVTTGKPLYDTGFGLKVTTSYDAFERPYTKWTKGKDSVEVMKPVKATFTTKFNACDLLAELGVKKNDKDTLVKIQNVYVNGVTTQTSQLLNKSNTENGKTYKWGELSHGNSVCPLEGYVHGAQGTLTQVFEMGKDNKDNKIYRVCSIDTWLAKVGTVTKKVTARDEHLRSDGSVKFAEVYLYDTTEANGFSEKWCNSTDAGRFESDTCAELARKVGRGTLTYDDPTGLAKDDYVLITYSEKSGEVESADVVEGKEGRLTGYINDHVASDPTSTRIDSEYIKDAVHFHLNYSKSKSDKYATYKFFYDAYGNVIGMTDATDTSNWGVIDVAWITFGAKGAATLNADIVGLDAKIAEESTVKKFNDIYTKLGVQKDSNEDDFAYDLAKTLKIATNGEGAKDFKPLYDHLYKFSVDTNGKYTVETSTDVKNLFAQNVDADGNTYGANVVTVKVTKDQPYIEGQAVVDGEYEQLKGLRMTSDTKILVHKMDGTYASYEGYKNVDSLIAHKGEYILSDDGKTIDVLYLCDDVYMTDGKFVAFVGTCISNKTVEMNDDTYYALTVYVNGEEDTVYLAKEDKAKFESKFTKGFYEMQFVEVDSVKTAKVLKGPHDSAYADIDEELNWTKTIVDMTNEWIVLYKNDNSMKELTVDFADDCAFYTIEDDSSKVLEKVTIDDVLDVYDYAASKGQKKIAYVSYNNDGDVNALYVILNETY